MNVDRAAAVLNMISATIFWESFEDSSLLSEEKNFDELTPKARGENIENARIRSVMMGTA